MHTDFKHRDVAKSKWNLVHVFPKFYDQAVVEPYPVRNVLNLRTHYTTNAITFISGDQIPKLFGIFYYRPTS